MYVRFVLIVLLLLWGVSCRDQRGVALHLPVHKRIEIAVGNNTKVFNIEKSFIVEVSKEWDPARGFVWMKVERSNDGSLVAFVDTNDDEVGDKFGGTAIDVYIDLRTKAGLRTDMFKILQETRDFVMVLYDSDYWKVYGTGSSIYDISAIFATNRRFILFSKRVNYGNILYAVCAPGAMVDKHKGKCRAFYEMSDGQPIEFLLPMSEILDIRDVADGLYVLMAKFKER